MDKYTDISSELCGQTSHPRRRRALAAAKSIRNTAQDCCTCSTTVNLGSSVNYSKQLTIAPQMTQPRTTPLTDSNDRTRSSRKCQACEHSHVINIVVTKVLEYKFYHVVIDSTTIH